MNNYIAEILKCKIQAVSFADKVAGMVRPVTHYRDGLPTVTYPVGYDVLHSDCTVGKESNLMPNSKYKSIMYFEDNGILAGKKEGSFQNMTASIRLVVWLNLQKITDEKCPDPGSVCAVLELMKALNNKIENASPIFAIQIEVQEIIRDKSIFSEYSYDEKYSQYLFHPYDFFAIKIKVNFKVNYDCTCADNLPVGCYPAIPSILKSICVDPDSFDGNMQEGDCLRLKDFEDGKYYVNQNGQWVEAPSGGTSDHASLNNLDFASSGHTGFEAEGAAAQALFDANNYTDLSVLWEQIGATSYIKPKNTFKIRPEVIDPVIYQVTTLVDAGQIEISLSSEESIEIEYTGATDSTSFVGTMTINDVISSNYYSGTVVGASFPHYSSRYFTSSRIILNRNINGNIYMEQHAQQRYNSVASPLIADRLLHGLLQTVEAGINKVTINAPAGRVFLAGTTIIVRRRIF